MKVILLLLLVWQSSRAFADFPRSTPEAVGLSSETLEELSHQLSTLLDTRKIPYSSLLVSRYGLVVHLDHQGKVGDNNKLPLTPHTLMRIYSMTKPIVATALMMLWEEGKFKLDDPIGLYLPNLKGLMVYAGHYKGLPIILPPRSQPTIRQILSHTGGFTYGIFENSWVDQQYKLHIKSERGDSLTGVIESLGQIPLLTEPGQRWIYSISSDIQGRLIEVLSGMELEAFLRKRLFTPLGMDATGFTVSPWDDILLADIFEYTEENGLQQVKAPLGPFVEKATFKSGGGGLVSTLYDYWQFAEMIRRKGYANGQMLLKPSTIDLIFKNHALAITGNPPFSNASGPITNVGYGLGIAAKNVGPSTWYYWPGIANTHFLVDPKNEISVVFMTQVLNNDLETVQNLLETMVYKAIL